MSNLYKQWYVTSKPDDTRVINSNDVLDEKIKEAMRYQAAHTRTVVTDHGLPADTADTDGALEGGATGEDAQSDTDEMTDSETHGGFTAGLAAETVSLFTDEDAANLKEETQKEVDTMLADAKANAEHMIEKAKEEAKRLHEEARKNGYDEGYSAGKKAADELKAGLREELEQEKSTLEEEYQKKNDALEPELLETILTVFDKVFHIQFSDKKEILTYLVKQTMLNASGCKEFVIRCSEDDYMSLKDKQDEIKSEVGAGVSVDVVMDPNYEAGKCIIETDAGLFDTSVDVHLENLKKDLRSLCQTQ